MFDLSKFNINFDNILQDMVKKVPVPSLFNEQTPSLRKEDRVEQPQKKTKKEQDLMNQIGLQIKRR